MRFSRNVSWPMCLLGVSSGVLVSAQPRLTTIDQVLNRYKDALGGARVIENVQSETQQGEIEVSGRTGKVRFVNHAKAFKSVQHLTLSDGSEIDSGFDGSVAWEIRGGKATIDRQTPVESYRRDADLQYALHQPDYFETFELAGVTEFEQRSCYWLHGTTHWGKDNNQFYDVGTGLLVGYRFQADQSDSRKVIVLVFSDYKSFGGPRVATKRTMRNGDRVQTVTVNSVTYEPLQDSLFELPEPVKLLLKQGDAFF